jgi:hypothetical protein
MFRGKLTATSGQVTLNVVGNIAPQCVRSRLLAINVENELIDAKSKLDRPRDVF